MQAQQHTATSPFDLANEDGYAAWRDRKLEGYPDSVDQLIVEISDPRRLTKAEFEALRTRARKTNMAIYACPADGNPDKAIPRSLGAQFGLTELDYNMGADDDGVTSLKVVEGKWRSGYIPYTNRPIHWHTDGYYNLPERQIQGLLLHCVSTAARGGENALLDHEIAYIHLRDSNPDYIHALTAGNVMTIPPNNENGEQLRPARSGPVFSVMEDGRLHMRFTARTRSIEWSPDPLAQSAVKSLKAFLDSPSPYIYRAILQPGQGVICNNVLHDRSGFDEHGGHKRQLYRLRYYQRMTGT